MFIEIIKSNISGSDTDFFPYFRWEQQGNYLKSLFVCDDIYMVIFKNCAFWFISLIVPITFRVTLQALSQLCDCPSRDLFVFGLSQWEMMLRCDVITHSLGLYPVPINQPELCVDKPHESAKHCNVANEIYTQQNLVYISRDIFYSFDVSKQ